jgi:uncharacterized protein YeaO (DUF488 family)
MGPVAWQSSPIGSGRNLELMVRIVRLGSPRTRNEGVRIGAVRRPPRGVPKAEFASRDFYDVWLPALAPSAELVSVGLTAATDAQWRTFERKYRAEMKQPDAARLLDLLAALSHQTNIAVGCYCEDERRCHRSILAALLRERGAEVA